MSGKGFEIWGFSASILGTLFLVPLIYAWSKGPLPSTKIRQMEVILSETEALLRSALQEGTIAYDHYDREFKSWLWQTKLQADELRASVYNIETFPQELRYWAGGLSNEISSVVKTLHKIRGRVARSSSRGREMLTTMGCTRNPTLEIYSQKHTVAGIMLPTPPPPGAVSASSAHLNGGSDAELQASNPPPCSYSRARHNVAAADRDVRDGHAPAAPSANGRPQALCVPLVYASHAHTGAKENYCATLNALASNREKLNGLMDAHATHPVYPMLPALPSPINTKNTSLSRLRAYVGRIFPWPCRSDTRLPRHTDASLIPLAFTASEKRFDSGALRWEEKEPVVVQVQLHV